MRNLCLSLILIILLLLSACTPAVTPDDGRCELYLQVLEDLWNIDAGLNSDNGLKYLGVDLSGLTHLAQSDRAAIARQFAGKHELILVEGTWEELCDEGYIDRERLVWTDGILFTITTNEEAVSSLPGANSSDGTSASTTFDAQKWRSGIGAILLRDCTAQRDGNGVWSYSLGRMLIS